MEEISPTKEKILQYLDYKGISKADFCRQTGFSYENFKGKSLKSDIGGAILGKIITIYSDISAEWLLTGEGAMLKSEQPSEEIEIPLQKPSNDLVTPLLDRIDSITRENERLKIENARLESELERMRPNATDAHSEPSARAV